MRVLLTGTRSSDSWNTIDQLLRSQGHEVVHRQTSVQAREAVQQLKPSLVVLVDPDDDTRAFSQKVREQDAHQPIILAAPSEVSHSELQTLWHAGIDDFIPLSQLHTSYGQQRLHWNKLRTKEPFGNRINHYKKLFEASPDPMIITLPDGEIVELNQAVANMFGYERSELQQYNITQLYAEPKPAKAFQRHLQEAMTGEVETQLRCQDNTVLTCLLTVTASEDQEGQPGFYQTTIRDITDQRQMEQDLLHISELERRRIGQDLHDGPASVLAGLAMLIRGLARQVEAGRSIPLKEIQQIATIVQQEAHETRLLAHGLNPVELKGQGFVGALKTLAQNIEFIFDTPCHLEICSNLPSLEKEVAIHLYRIIQEAVHNAARHGQPSCIDVTLESNSHHLVACIEDDGQGMPENRDKPSGLGLRTLRHRANVLGGTCVIDSSPGKGTCLTCTVPAVYP